MPRSCSWSAMRLAGGVAAGRLVPGTRTQVASAPCAAGGPDAVTSLLRASGLALPAIAVAGSLAALAVRRM